MGSNDCKESQVDKETFNNTIANLYLMLIMITVILCMFIYYMNERKCDCTNAN